MVFLEVEDLDRQRDAILESGLIDRYPGAKISAIQGNDRGREFPSTIHPAICGMWGRFYNGVQKSFPVLGYSRQHLQR